MFKNTILIFTQVLGENRLWEQHKNFETEKAIPISPHHSFIGIKGITYNTLFRSLHWIIIQAEDC